jgi:ABC-type glycerol-3-phosphate transport system substrate-binding protein
MLLAMLLTVLLFALTLGACNLASDEESTPAATQAVSAPTAVETVVVEETPAAQETPAPVTSVITLTLWTNPEYALGGDLAGSTVLQEQLNAFENEHPDIHLFVEAKTVTDQGGILSYLRSGRGVAPTILPDVVMLPGGSLATAAAEGLIFPVDEVIDAEMIEDLYPAAQQLTTVGESLYGYPFALTNLQHLVYRSGTITETLPSDWPGLVSSSAGTFIFPAGGPVGAELTLQFYRESGGILQNEQGQSVLQVEPLTIALQAIQDGVSNDFIDVQSGSTATTEQAWQIFQTGPDYIVQTTAGHFLKQGAENAGYDTVPLPGPEGPLAPLLNGWVWSISTPDPARQALAGELIRWLSDPARLGEWTYASKTLPARESAFTAWPEDGTYVPFVQRQLIAAGPYPAGSSNTLLSAVSNATTAVILGLNTPEGAATEASQALQP